MFGPIGIGVGAFIGGLAASLGSFFAQSDREPRAELAQRIFEEMLQEVRGFLSGSKVDELEKLGTVSEILNQLKKKNAPNLPARALEELTNIAGLGREKLLQAIRLLDGLNTIADIRRVRGADIARVLFGNIKAEFTTFGRRSAKGEPNKFAGAFDAVSGKFIVGANRTVTTRLERCGVLRGAGGDVPTWEGGDFSAGRKQWPHTEAFLDALNDAIGERAVRDGLKGIADQCEAIQEQTKEALRTTPIRFRQQLPGDVTRVTELAGLGKGATSVQRGILAREFGVQGADLSAFGFKSGVAVSSALGPPTDIKILSDVRDFILEDDFVIEFLKKAGKIQEGLSIPTPIPVAAATFNI